jgi:ankyrin repeat protein
MITIFATTSILGKRKSRGGGNVESKTYQGDTPLHCASRNGQLDVVKASVSGGADILAANNGERLPIHEAVRRQQSEVSKYLLQHSLW